jgi:hypothetical protein
MNLFRYPSFYKSIEKRATNLLVNITAVLHFIKI